MQCRYVPATPSHCIAPPRSLAPPTHHAPPAPSPSQDKSSDGKEEVAKILPSLRAASAVGVFAKDKHDGPLVATFFEALGDSKTADVSAAAAEVMAVKDEAEQARGGGVWGGCVEGLKTQ